MEQTALRLPLLAACLLLSSSSAPARQVKPVPAAPAVAVKPSYAGEAVIVEQVESVFRYNADGTGTQDVHVLAKIQNEAGAKQMSVITATYAAETQTAQVRSLSARHADGTTTVTPPSDAMELPTQVTQAAPLYSDGKVLQIPVRGLRSGDLLEYRIRITQTKPEAANEFWNSSSFLKGIVARSESLTLDLPAGLSVQVWSPKYKAVKTEAGGRVVYRWRASQLEPTSGAKSSQANAATPASTNPDVAWTTFKDWQQVGDWYRSLAAPRAVPTDALRTQAEQITQGAKTPEDQVKAIYAFVSTRIRYIGVDFGVGRFEPHAAAEVLANQYGDCKDKDTLLEALLRARGFSTAPALVGVGIDMIPELPTPQLFNHVITTVDLPSGKIWLDSTPEVAPYRYLLPTIRDKQVLVIPATGGASLQRTPAEPPYPFVNRFTAKGSLRTDGELDAHVEIEDRSDAEIVLRLLARNLAPAQWDKGAQYLAQLQGFSGTTSNATFGRADDISVPMRVSYDYTAKSFSDWDNLRIVPLFPLLGLPGAPDSEPSSALDLGAPRTAVAVSQMQLPATYGAELPDAVHLKTPFATFDETYDLENGVLTVRRTVVVLEPKLPAASWQDYRKFVKSASLGALTYIQLNRPGAAAGAPSGNVTEIPGSAEAASLIQDATRLEQAHEWAAALSKLDQAKALQPEQPYLWSNYGYIEIMQHDMDAALINIQKELTLHPGEIRPLQLEVSVLHALHRDPEALDALSTAFNRDHANPQVALMLAGVEAQNHVPDAIATLKIALGASPKDPLLMLAMADYLMRDNRAADAASFARQALALPLTLEELNDASYLLAETGSELPLAEQKSRQSLDMLDAETSQAVIGSANQHSFQRAMELAAGWDTLGYILLRENKLEEARDYLEAGWRNRPGVATGLHYGEALEKLGKKEEALRVFRMAQETTNVRGAGESADQLELRKAIQRIEAAGVRAPKDPALELQNERTFHILLPHAYPTFLSAVFRLQLQSSGVHDLLLVSGNAALHSATDAIRQLKLPNLVPQHSTALLLRDAMVTCSARYPRCELVLLPMGGMSAEQP